MFPSYRNRSVDLICKSTGFYTMGTLVVKGLINYWNNKFINNFFIYIKIFLLPKNPQNKRYEIKKINPVHWTISSSKNPTILDIANTNSFQGKILNFSNMEYSSNYVNKLFSVPYDKSSRDNFSTKVFSQKPR